MAITLSELLSSGIFESYKIASGKSDLERPIEGISLLETPDFFKYIVPRTFILTTLYPIKSDEGLFLKLIKGLSENGVAGIAIKLKRYVDFIPEAIVSLANDLHFPIITLDYDANLSTIASRILNELSAKTLKKASLASVYFDMVNELEANPSIDSILALKSKLSDVDFWIYSQEQNREYVTDPSLKTLMSEIKIGEKEFLYRNGYFIYTDEVSVSKQPIYKLVLFSKENNQSAIYYYSEIIKMLLIFVRQKRQENSLKQNQFILELVTDVNSAYTKNDEFISLADFYRWKVKFPLALFLFDVQMPPKMKVTLSRIGEGIRTTMLSSLGLEKDELRYVVLNDRIFFLANDTLQGQLKARVRQILSEVENNYRGVDFKVAFKSNITDVRQIPQNYVTLSRGLTLIGSSGISEKIFNDQTVQLFSLLGKIPENELREYVDLVLGKLKRYQEKNGGELIDTLFVLLNHQFNLKKTAKAMFIHYNTLRHRIQVLENLGYGKNDIEVGNFDLFLAIYLAKNILI